MDFKDIYDLLDVPMMLLELGQSGAVILDYNPAYSKFTGNDKLQVHGRHFFEVFPDNPFLDFGIPWRDIFHGLGQGCPKQDFIVQRWTCRPQPKMECFRVQQYMINVPNSEKQVLLQSLIPMLSTMKFPSNVQLPFGIDILPWCFDPLDGKFMVSSELRSALHADPLRKLGLQELFPEDQDRKDFQQMLAVCADHGIPIRHLCTLNGKWPGKADWLISGFRGTGSSKGLVLGYFSGIPVREPNRQMDTLDQDRLRTIVSSVDAILWEGDVGNLSTTYVSPKVFDILGYTQQEWMSVRRKWEEVLHPQDRERILAQLEEQLKGSGRFGSVYRLVHKKGHSVWVKDNVVLVPGADGSLFLRGVMIDVSDSERWNIFKEMEGSLLETISLGQEGFSAGLTFFLKGMQTLFEGRTYQLVTGHIKGDSLLAGPENSFYKPSGDPNCYILCEDITGEAFKLLEYASDWTSRMVDPPGLFDRCLSVLRLVLEHRQKTSHASELIELNRQVQEMANFGFWQWDLASDKLEWSEELYRILGEDPQRFQPISKNYNRFIHPQDRRKVQRIFHQIQNGLNESIFEARVISSSGGIKHLRCWVRRLGNGTRQPVRLMGGCLDMTKVQEVELQRENLFQDLLMQMKELEESQSKYYGLFHNIPMPVLLVRNCLGRILDANQSALDTYGLTQSELLSIEFGEMFVPEERYSPQEVSALKDMLEPSSIFLHRSRSKGRIFVKMVQAPTMSKGEDSSIILLEDITQKVGHLMDIRKKTTALKRISWIHSHLVRAPLSRILALSHLLDNWKQQDLGNAQFSELLEKIMDAAHELDGVVRQVTDSSNSEMNLNDNMDGKT